MLYSSFSQNSGGFVKKSIILWLCLSFSGAVFAADDVGSLDGLLSVDAPYSDHQFKIACTDSKNNTTEFLMNGQGSFGGGYPLHVGPMSCTLSDVTWGMTWNVRFELANAKDTSTVDHSTKGNYLYLRVSVTGPHRSPEIFGYSYVRQ